MLAHIEFTLRHLRPPSQLPEESEDMILEMQSDDLVGLVGGS